MDKTLSETILPAEHADSQQDAQAAG